MKFNKKIISIIIVGSIISTSYMTFALQTPVTTQIPKTSTAVNDIEESVTLEFAYFTGKITAINNSTDADGKEIKDSKVVLLKDSEGKEVNFKLNEKTYYVNKDFKVGDTVTGFYDPKLPTTRIYPPLYTAIVFSLSKDDGVSIKVDRFDENLLSHDGSLQLNVSDKTVIVDEDGKVFKGDIKNRKLVVIYGITTMSIPAQTPPTKIIVLFETAVAPILTMPAPETVVPPILVVPKSETPEASEPAVSNKKLALTVNNISLKSTEPFLNDKGIVMVPFRDVCEALNLKITWNDEDKSIVLDNKISFSVGKDVYNLNKSIITLGTAPVIVDEKTFVPLKFFTEVLNLNNGYVLENTVFIDNGVKMD